MGFQIAHKKGHFWAGSCAPHGNLPMYGKCGCPVYAADEYICCHEGWHDKMMIQPIAILLWTPQSQTQQENLGALSDSRTNQESNYKRYMPVSPISAIFWLCTETSTRDIMAHESSAQYTTLLSWNFYPKLILYEEKCDDAIRVLMAVVTACLCLL